jgi:hypothetical protein
VNKKAFALFFTIFLVLTISILSYRVVENKIFLSNLNTLKYLHLQANIHMDFVKEYIENRSVDQITHLNLSDNRFSLDLEHEINSDGKDVFYVVIATVDLTPVRLSNIIIK